MTINLLIVPSIKHCHGIDTMLRPNCAENQLYRQSGKKILFVLSQLCTLEEKDWLLFLHWLYEEQSNWKKITFCLFNNWNHQKRHLQHSAVDWALHCSVREDNHFSRATMLQKAQVSQHEIIDTNYLLKQNSHVCLQSSYELVLTCPLRTRCRGGTPSIWKAGCP